MDRLGVDAGDLFDMINEHVYLSADANIMMCTQYVVVVGAEFKCEGCSL